MAAGAISVGKGGREFELTSSNVVMLIMTGMIYQQTQKMVNNIQVEAWK